jgi:hypothetical protein
MHFLSSSTDWNYGAGIRVPVYQMHELGYEEAYKAPSSPCFSWYTLPHLAAQQPAGENLFRSERLYALSRSSKIFSGSVQ